MGGPLAANDNGPTAFEAQSRSGWHPRSAGGSSEIFTLAQVAAWRNLELSTRGQINAVRWISCGVQAARPRCLRRGAGAQLADLPTGPIPRYRLPGWLG